MSARLIVAIDPGLTGAIALLDGPRLETVHDMPVTGHNVDAYELTRILAEIGPVDRVIVETQQAMPRQGVSSTFKTGANYGRLLGVLAALKRPVTHVSPASWTRALRVGSDKSAHRARAMDEWPEHAALFKRAKDDGRADAALIGLYGTTL